MLPATIDSIARYLADNIPALAMNTLQHRLAAVMIGLSLLIFIEAGWYAIVALTLSAPSHRATYLRCKSKLDRIAGGVLAALGIKLVVGAYQP